MGVTNTKTSETPGGTEELVLVPLPPPHPPNRRRIKQRGIILANNHLSLKLFILLPPVYWPFENGIIDSRIDDLSPFTLIAHCNSLAMVHKMRGIGHNKAIFLKCMYF